MKVRVSLPWHKQNCREALKRYSLESLALVLSASRYSKSHHGYLTYEIYWLRACSTYLTGILHIHVPPSYHIKRNLNCLLSVQKLDYDIYRRWNLFSATFSSSFPTNWPNSRLASLPRNSKSVEGLAVIGNYIFTSRELYFTFLGNNSSQLDSRQDILQFSRVEPVFAENNFHSVGGHPKVAENTISCFRRILYCGNARFYTSRQRRHPQFDSRQGILRLSSFKRVLAVLGENDFNRIASGHYYS